MSFNSDIQEINELNNQLNNLKISNIHNLIEKNELLKKLIDKISNLNNHVNRCQRKSEEYIRNNCKHNMIYEPQDHDKSLLVCSICGYIGY